MSTVGNWRGPNIIKDNLVFYLNTSSSNCIYPKQNPLVWKDISGRGYNGTPYNSPTYDSSVGNGVVSFDGLDDYIDFGNNMPLNGSGTISISMWVYVSTNTLKLLFTRYNTSDITRLAEYVGLVSGSVGMTPRLYVGTTTNYIYWTANSEAVSLNAWQHLTFTTNDTSVDVKCYVNGSEIALTSTQSGFPPPTFNNLISDRYWMIARAVGATGAISYHDFKIGDLLIYNKTLSSTEVQTIYNSTKSRFGL